MRSRRLDRQDEQPGESLILPSGPPCKRCNGDRHGDQVQGGWLPHFRFMAGGWYSFAHCCPDCAFGAYRLRCTNQPVYRQFPDADLRELGIFQSYLRRGRSLVDAAEAVPFPALRERLLDAARRSQAAERGFTQPVLPVQSSAEVGF